MQDALSQLGYTIPLIVVCVLGYVALTWGERQYAQKQQQWGSVMAENGRTGAEVVRLLLDDAGLEGLPIALHEKENSYLHRGKKRKQGIYLKDTVYNRNSLYAVSVAAHEVGHAIQYHSGYWLARTYVRRPVAFGSASVLAATGLAVLVHMFVPMPPVVAALVMVSSTLAVLAEGLYTLPLELNASARALSLLRERGLIEPQEIEPCRVVLKGAALTYLMSSLTNLVLLPAFYAAAFQAPSLLEILRRH